MYCKGIHDKCHFLLILIKLLEFLTKKSCRKTLNKQSKIHSVKNVLPKYKLLNLRIRLDSKSDKNCAVNY